MSSRRPARIEVLEDQVAAKLTSTVLITSVSDVVVGLFANSIDGGATKVEISWRVRDGYVDVVDNGVGIHPEDLDVIGAKFGTSRMSTDGYNGAFLFALAQISQLHVFSRHTGFIPTYLTRFNFGKKLACAIELNESRRLTSTGTKVWARNISGDVPLRAQRRNEMTVTEERRLDRDVHRRVIEALLCAPNCELKVTLDDSRKRSVFVLHAGDTGLARRRKILGVAGFPAVEWKHAAAEWGDIKVDAMIGSSPISDSHVQFLIINGAPVRRGAPLYTKLNALFNASNFATISGKTGADKHAAFVMRIDASDIASHKWTPQDLDAPVENELFRLLESLLEQFLRECGYKLRRRRGRPEGSTGTKVKKLKSVQENLPIFERELWEGKSRSSLNVPWKDAADDELLERVTAGMAEIRRANWEEAARARAAVVPAPENVPASSSKSTGRPSSRPDTTRGPGLPAIAYVQSPFLAPGKLTLASIREDPQLFTREMGPRVREIRPQTFENAPVYPLPEAQIYKPFSSREGRPYSKLDEGKMVTLNKKSLETARVLPRQLSDKFILAVTEQPQALVAADQHAVDERIRLEDLWRGYDNQPKLLSKPISFKLPFQDGEQLVHHLAQVRDWGFVLEVTEAQGKAIVDVHGAQELVAERCVADPSIMIDIIADWVGEMKNDGFKVYPAGCEWVKRQACAPKKLADVFASRACRSAVMFNDELTHDECIMLIRKLAKCTFPFICAHGRPSVVPIFDLTAGGVVEPFTDDMCGSMR
ncbi:hypothetical protein ABW21_db0208645 [Orbilia brochopaga]|nr:hypothetical protein ABW21_db0208645 [Drechslerella brochopaga]